MKVYKIRRKADGLFSTGGTSPRWSKLGKTWNAIGHLKNHLNLFKEYSCESHSYYSTLDKAYRDCDVVEYEMVVSTTELVCKDVQECHLV